jgi:hypothetical protein
MVQTDRLVSLGSKKLKVKSKNCGFGSLHSPGAGCGRDCFIAFLEL